VKKNIKWIEVSDTLKQNDEKSFVLKLTRHDIYEQAKIINLNVYILD